MDFILVFSPSYDRAAEIPVGGLFLCDALLKKDYSVGVINDFSHEEILAAVHRDTDEQTIAFGISTVSVLTFRDTIAISKALKEAYPHIPVVWGGQAVAANPEEILAFECVDYIVVGEAEEALPELLAHLKQGREPNPIKGVGYKRDGKSILQGIADYTELTGVVELPYHLLDMPAYYRQLNIGGDRWLGAMYSRGCPFKCSFCYNSTIHGINTRIRFHEIDHVIHDIKRLSEQYGADSVTIHDDHFLINENRVVRFCQRLLDEGITVNLRANGRIDTINRMKDSTLALLKQVGFVNLISGIESGSPRMLEILNKNITLEQIEAVDAKLGQHGLYKHWNFMTALPGETIEDVALTLELIVRLARTSMDSPFPFSYRKYVPLPDTALYEMAVREYGLEVPESIEGWRDFSDRFLDERETGDLGMSTRPWMDLALATYTDVGEKLVLAMNRLFIGQGADRAAIAQAVDALQAHVEQGLPQAQRRWA
ncbi:B12-binding domain-containing radical SAM protein [Magnetococcus sp. PR-3]|uniref:B12-binding domain-containing radical SAM protein n=1 Tax=Magnetococcus sp. PR-3 TaxID=3120355 RepID=UPI002FCE5A7E